jgi:lipoate-protein ligase A
LDPFQPLADLARAPPLLRAQAGLPSLRNPESLSDWPQSGQEPRKGQQAFLTLSASGSVQWYVLKTGAHPAAENMAIDEVLLESAPQFGKPVLRFYEWSEPAATFGYFQKFNEVECMTSLRPLIRRPTGGGLVPHDADWTYSFIFPPTDSWYHLKAVESYRHIHEWLQAAFGKIGIAAELSASTDAKAPERCFVGAQRSDLLWHGRKIAGAAQRRTRQGLLIQGSIQPPAGVDRGIWEGAFCAVARALWQVEWLPLKFDAALQQQAIQLAASKYGTVEYNNRRR